MLKGLAVSYVNEKNMFESGVVLEKHLFLEASIKDEKFRNV